MLHEMTCEHSWFKQMCKDKSGRDETTNFLTLLSRMVWKLFHTFPRHWRHQFWSLLVQREDKQSGTERRGVWTLYDNDTRDRVHIVVHLLSVLFMIRMLMSFPLWYHGALSGCTDSAAATRTNHWTVSAVFLFFFRVSNSYFVAGSFSPAQCEADKARRRWGRVGGEGAEKNITTMNL